MKPKTNHGAEIALETTERQAVAPAATCSPIFFDINYKVRVKLNPWGRGIYMDHYAKYGVECEPPERDSDGWSEFQLWNLMEVYGPHMTIGMKVPFETEIALYPENAPILPPTP